MIAFEFIGFRDPVIHVLPSNSIPNNNNVDTMQIVPIISTDGDDKLKVLCKVKRKRVCLVWLNRFREKRRCDESHNICREYAFELRIRSNV